MGENLVYNTGGYAAILNPVMSRTNTTTNAFSSLGSLGGGGNTFNTINQTPSTWGNLNGSIGAGANVLGAIGSSLGAYWGYKNGKKQAKAMQQQVDLMDKQMKIENERYEKREGERLANAAEFQSQGSSFSQDIDKQAKQTSDLPTTRI